MRRLFNLFVLFFVVSVMTINFVSCDADSSGGGGTPEIDATLEKEAYTYDLEEGGNLKIKINTKNYGNKLEFPELNYEAEVGNAFEEFEYDETYYSYTYKEYSRLYSFILKAAALPKKKGTYTYSLIVVSGTLDKELNFTVKVTGGGAVGPVIKTQPQDGKLPESGKYKISVVAELEDGTNAGITYQWYKYNSASDKYEAISGATNSYYEATEIGNYKVKVTANGISIESNPVLINSGSSGPDVTITEQPTNQEVVKKSDISYLSVAVSSNGTATYKWYKVDGSASSQDEYQNCTSNSFKPSDFGSYYCRIFVTKDGTTISKDSNTATVSEKPVKVEFTKNLADNSYTKQSLSVTLSTEYGYTYEYQWKRGEIGESSDSAIKISGATSSSYTPTEPGLYLCTVKAVSGQGTGKFAVGDSKVCKVIENSTGIDKPTFTSQPENKTLFEGESFTLKAEATGSGTITYQWYKNSNAISGATSKTYTISNAKTTDSGSYYCKAINTKGSATSEDVSNTAIVTVNSINGSAPVGFDFN